jgi:hypothetical protein
MALAGAMGCAKNHRVVLGSYPWHKLNTKDHFFGLFVKTLFELFIFFAV